MKIAHVEYDILSDHGGPFTGARVVMSDIGQAYFNLMEETRIWLMGMFFKNPTY